MKRILILAFALSFGLATIPARADDASHQAALKEMSEAAHMEENMTNTIDAMLDLQIKQDWAMASDRAVMSQFLQKPMSWASLEPEVSKLYIEEFTEDEIKQLTTFDRSPLGQKMLTKMPALVAKGRKWVKPACRRTLASCVQWMQDEDARQGK
jgi:hypothetical protein